LAELTVVMSIVAVLLLVVVSSLKGNIFEKNAQIVLANKIIRNAESAIIQIIESEKTQCPEGKFMSKLEGLYKAKVDWKKELKKIVGNSISPDDKRSALVNRNVLVSQSRFTRTDKDKFDSPDYMMVWVDSSYSMSDEELKMCLTEIYSVALAKKPLKLVVVQCDTKIQEIKEFKTLQELKSYAMHATVKGRGGTELKPCWDLLKNDSRYNRRKPDIVIIFTDGGLTQYKRDIRTMKNLCWCIINNPAFNVQYKDPNTKCLHIKK
jgi:predicted metal-dependent peptidase